MNEEKYSITPSSQASYLDLFMRLLDSVFLLDRETYRILEANDASERLLNQKPEVLKGQSILDFITEDQLDEVNKKLRIARRKYYPIEFEIKLRPINEKELYVRANACSLKLSDQSEVLQVIVKDITREKEAQQVLQAYMAELKKLNEKLELLSTTDELTQLYNVRRFRARMKEEYERSRRYPVKYAIILFDVDHFKNYNDKHGHPAGDELLRTLGRLIKENSRATDFPARYGGEEFIILCPEATTETGRLVAERYRKIIENHPFQFAKEQPLAKVSVSVGVASSPESGSSPEDVIKAADVALYHSKRNGRNRTTTFEDVPPDQRSQESKA